jgi:dolichyl-diphosphooligosaccharide---protein glycosyltransferase
LSYFYMVASWGGYSFIINIIPVFVLGTMFINRFTLKIYVAYSVFYTLGTILAMLITFVNFQVMRSAEHLASHFTFVAINLFVLGTYIKNGLEEAQVRAIMRLASSFTVVGFILLFLFLTVSGTTKISGRVMVLIDPTHAKNNSPLVQSVAEHSPSTWASYFLHMHVLVIFAPVGFYYTLVHKITHGKLFLGMYGVFIAYFSCVMNRLQIVLAPAVCALSAIAVSQIIRKTTKSIRLAIIGKK